MALNRPPGTRVGSERRLLVVDDDPAVRRVLVLSLRGHGFDVATAADGLVALEMLGRESFGAVLLDCVMPRLDGFEVLRRLRQTGMEVPVILISGSLDERREMEALALGAVALLRKPPDLSRLARLCRELTRVAPGTPPLRR